MVGADASHAWVSVFCPGFGWMDLDPTNDVVPAEKHVTLAYGRDFGDVTPLRGVILGGGPHELKVAVDVVPVASNGADEEGSFLLAGTARQTSESGAQSQQTFGK
jgi:transglutaminase-like putative cysteine protease